MLSKYKILCDCKISPFCKINYWITNQSEKKNRFKNNGKYRCKYCAIHDTHLGDKSHYHKYSNINHNYFNTIDSEIKAYMLGIIAGDGSITSKTLEVVANKCDTETLEKFRVILPELRIHNKNKSNCNYIKITSRQISQDIQKHLNINVGKKSDKITLPKLDDNLIKHFIRGLMDSDGCIDNPFTSEKSPRCFYSSTSKIILNEIKILMSDINISSYISGIKLFFSGKNAIKFMNYIYEESNEYLIRKKCFYKVWKTWKPYEGTIISPSKRKLKRKL